MKRNLKLISVALFLSILVILSSCESSLSFSDGTIHVDVTGLDELTGFTLNSSHVECRVFTKDGSTYEWIPEIYSGFPNCSTTSLAPSSPQPNTLTNPATSSLSSSTFSI